MAALSTTELYALVAAVLVGWALVVAFAAAWRASRRALRDERAWAASRVDVCLDPAEARLRCVERRLEEVDRAIPSLRRVS